MSFATSEGKDQLIFVTKEDHENPEKVEILEEPIGIIYPSGEINWDCPCLGDLPHGPCGKEFKAAFSCFHFSTAESKGSDCIPAFRDMQECFEAHPEIYEDDEENGGTDESGLRDDSGIRVSEGDELTDQGVGDDRNDSQQVDS